MDLDRQISRRGLLRGAGAATALALVDRGAVASALGRGSGRDQPRVAIVGAGLAGLTCAVRLRQRGIRSTVFEAHGSRVGGRCWTARGFVGGETAEHGGEFIDTRHRRIRALAAELGLKLDDVRSTRLRAKNLHPRIYLDGAVRRFSAVYRDEDLLERRAAADARRIGDYGWRRPSAAARQLDEMTAAQWLDSALASSDSRLLRLAVEQYMAEEYGLGVDRLSAITMVSEFGPGGVYSDERFHVRGGNDQIPWRLRERLPAGSVEMDHPLVSLRRRGDSYALGFAGRRGEVIADVVVLCLPFPALRRVDLTGAGLGRRKLDCVEELGMGTNAKLLVQFEQRLGAYDDFNGEFYDEQLDTWNSSLAEPGTQGLLTVYSGGRRGAGYRVASPHAPAPAPIVHSTLAAISRAVPGLAEGYSGRSWLDHWVADPWTHGSYAAFLPGQFTRYWGFVGIPEGRIHFGGEHTSTGAQGFLEGAVSSGERCASEVAAQLRLRRA